MTRALDMRENQVRAILRAARKERVRVEVKIGDVVITAIPDRNSRKDDAVDEGISPETFSSLDDYLSWRDRSLAGEDQGRS